MTTRRPWTPEDDVLLRRLCEDGKSDRAIASALGRHRTTIIRRRKILNLAVKCKGGRRWGFKHSDEWKARKSEEMKRRWRESPEWAAKVRGVNLRLGPAAWAAKHKFRPPERTPEFNLYRKLRRSLSREVARRELGL